MTLQTGGLAVGEISTRSRSFSRAISCACVRGTIPTWFPSASIRRTSGMPRIISLILDSGSAGLRSNREPRRGGKILVFLLISYAECANLRINNSQSQGARVFRFWILDFGFLEPGPDRRFNSKSKIPNPKSTRFLTTSGIAFESGPAPVGPDPPQIGRAHV